MTSSISLESSEADSISPDSLTATRRSSMRRSTARRSFLNIFTHLSGDGTIPEGETVASESTTRIDELPPRLPSLDLPRQDVSFQKPQSPNSIRSITSAHSTRPLSRRSNASVISPPIQTPAPVARRDHNTPDITTAAVDQNPARQVSEASVTGNYGEVSAAYRHPADTMPNRHPADPLPSQSISGASEASGDSGRSRRRKRRNPRNGAQRLPRDSRRRRLFPALRYASVRRKALHCIITGGIMLLILIVFLALMNTSNDFAQEFRIITVLFMLIFVVLFAHSLLRLVVLLLRLRRNGGLADPDDNDPEAFAQVTEPIPVTFARDEELGISGNQPTVSDKDVPPPPPAYGRWRGSVRVDPNLIHWERTRTHGRPLSEGTLRRPPSYISEEISNDEAALNQDNLSEKPIRPRTPPIEPEPSSQRQRAAPTVIYDIRQSWVPQMPQNSQTT